MLQIPLSGIKRIEEVVNSSNKYISLSQGALKIGGIPAPVKQFVKTILDTTKTDSYGSSFGLKELRETIAQIQSARYNNTITPSQVLPTHGGIGALSLVFLNQLEAGDEVIIPEPAYPSYAILAQTARAKAVFVSCLKDSGDNSKVMWEIDVDKIKAATTPKTKIIVFSNPTNPTGLVIPKSTILELLDWCEQKGIYLIVDEAYRDYFFDESFESMLSIAGQSERLITISSFSKNMAMSGWRIGYLVAHESLIPALSGIQDALLNCLNNTAQYAAMYAMTRPDLVEELAKKVQAGKDAAVSCMQPLVDKGIFSFEIPKGGFFLFLKTDQADATDLCLSILNKAKVGMIPGSTFGTSGKPFIRLCFARDAEVIETGIDRLKKYFL
ncbi:MAG: pyridoxal phosphate-dependent aminotransferase [Candidatus Babeliales bacterium]|jgi:aspartate aminotransferase/aminotransferase